MAGLGFKDFQVGEVLTSSDVDGYLMQQAVMRFADSGARGSALGTAPGTAVALAEGMVSYRDDINALQVYNGSAWTSPLPGIGSNVVQAVKTDTFSTSSSSYEDVLTASITPSSDTAKVLVFASIPLSFQDATANRSAKVSLFRSTTNLAVPDSPSNRTPVMSSLNNAEASSINVQTLTFLDSPASSTAVTYSVAVTMGGSSGTLYVNRGDDDTDTAGRSRGITTLTLIEVAP